MSIFYIPTPNFIFLLKSQNLPSMTNPQTWFCQISCKNSHLTRQSYRCELFIYLCSFLSTQFLYRTAVKATFNVKENIKDNIKNSITLIINITTPPTIFRKFRWQNHICFSSFPMLIILQYYLKSVYNINKFL